MQLRFSFFSLQQKVLNSRGRSPVEHRGNLSIHPSVCPSICPSVCRGRCPAPPQPKSHTTQAGHGYRWPLTTFGLLFGLYCFHHIYHFCRTRRCTHFIDAGRHILNKNGCQYVESGWRSIHLPWHTLDLSMVGGWPSSSTTHVLALQGCLRVSSRRNFKNE